MADDFDCKCTAWSLNFTSGICEDKTRPSVQWEEGSQHTDPVYCCKWEYQRCGRSNTYDPCDHSSCSSNVITQTMNCDHTSYCATPAEAQLILYIILGSLAFLVFIGCSVLYCVYYADCCKNSRSTMKYDNSNNNQIPDTNRSTMKYDNSNNNQIPDTNVVTIVGSPMQQK
jgi:hypothetical protein